MIIEWASMSTHRLVLLRHGQSQWNLEDRFTGWADVDLSDEGEREARGAARLLREQGFAFDIAYTSVLRRCGSCWTDWTGCGSRSCTPGG